MGPHVVASRDINCGEVLFVEKAYSFDYTNSELSKSNKEFSKLHCSFCAFSDEALIPCKECVKVVYCTEKCRDEAWNEYHQWECGYLKIGVILSREASLALHTVCKAAHTGIATETIHYNKGTNTFKDQNKAYNYIYNFKTDVLKFKEVSLQQFILLISDSLFLVIYLKHRTNFFDYVRRSPKYDAMKNDELECTLGRLILRHSIQHCSKALSIFDWNLAECGRKIEYAAGFYPSVGQLTHSCVPNTCQYFVRDIVVVKSIKPIKSGTIVYRSAAFDSLRVIYMSQKDQKMVLEKCVIACKCNLCTGKELDRRTLDSRHCPECNGSARKLCDNDEIEESLWFCQDCKKKYFLPFEGLVYLLPLQCQQMENANLAKYAITKLKTMYKSSHSCFLKLYMVIIQTGTTEDVLAILEEAKTVFQIRLDCFSFEYGWSLLIMSLALCKLMEEDQKMSSNSLRTLIRETKMFLNQVKGIMEVYCPKAVWCANDLEMLLVELNIKHMVKLSEH